MVLENFLKGHAYYGHWIKRTSNKLLLGAQGFCPLKYTNCGNKFLNFYFFGFLLAPKVTKNITMWTFWKLLSFDSWKCEGPTDKLFLSTNQIVGILCPLDQWP
jgi:hypothetical protein